MSEDQTKALQLRNPVFTERGSEKRKQASKEYSEYYRKIRTDYQEKGREKARKGTDLYCIGCMLFWAEGRKSRNSVSLTNMDENMLVLFVRFLRECFGVKQEDFKVSINCRSGNGLSVEEIESHWLHLFGLERTNLRKTYIDHDKRSVGSKTKQVYGICEITVNRTDIVQEIYGFIQEAAAFTSERFLG